jgi:exodeoxyribonuclease V alpha subunit
MPTDLAGQIENITFANKENGFTVARVKVRGSRGLVTVAGTMMAPMAGEILEIHGEWSTHPKY